MAFAFRSVLWMSTVIIAQVASSSPASDLQSYSIEKGIELSQTNAGVPAPKPSNGYVFRADLIASAPNNVPSATVTTPGGASVKTLVMSSGNDELSYDKKEDSLSILNNSFPNGNYALTVTTAHEGTRVLTLSLEGDAYPTTAHVLSFDQAQNTDAGSFNEFRWEYLNDGVVPDYVQFRIEDSQGNKVFETADDGPAALDGRADSVLLPPGTLAAGQAYKATLRTRKTVYDIASDPPSVGSARYYRRVTFDINTQPTASKADVKDFSVLKTEIWEQTGANPPVPASKNGFVFDTRLEASAPASVIWASLSTPLGTSSLDPNSDRSAFEFKDKKDTKNGFDTAYPSGTYVFNVAGASNGSVYPSLQLGPDAYPEVAQFLYPERAQSIDPLQDFTFQWNPFANGTSSDFIQLRIDDENGNKILETPDFEKVKALTGLQTTTVVPTGTLAPGKGYTTRLLFLKITDLSTTQYPGALGIAGFGRETRLAIRTSGETVVLPSLSSVQFVPGQGLSFWINGTPGATYRIQASADLVTWTTAATVTLASQQTQYAGQVAPTDPHRYFRLVQQ